MKIGFVTDSTADLPADLVIKHDIRVVPALVNIEGRSYLDGIEISREEYYSRLPGYKPPPTTSAPSIGDFQKRYESLLKAGAAHIISIHAANTLSGIFNAARLAAQDFGDRIHVLDSGQLTLGIGFQLLGAVESAARGAILGEVLEVINSIRRRVRLVALLDTLEYLRRSGRVSWTRALVGNFLNIKPLLGLRDGIVLRLGQARTRTQGILRLKETLHSWGPIEHLAVLHTNAEEAAHKLLSEIRPRSAPVPLVVNVTTAIGTHVGPNGLGVVAVVA